MPRSSLGFRRTSARPTPMCARKAPFGRVPSSSLSLSLSGTGFGDEMAKLSPVLGTDSAKAQAASTSPNASHNTPTTSSKRRRRKAAECGAAPSASKAARNGVRPKLSTWRRRSLRTCAGGAAVAARRTGGELAGHVLCASLHRLCRRKSGRTPPMSGGIRPRFGRLQTPSLATYQRCSLKTNRKLGRRQASFGLANN